MPSNKSIELEHFYTANLLSIDLFEGITNIQVKGGNCLEIIE
jgi:hypothetical protein